MTNCAAAEERQTVLELTSGQKLRVLALERTLERLYEVFTVTDCAVETPCPIPIFTTSSSPDATVTVIGFPQRSQQTSTGGRAAVASVRHGLDGQTPRLPYRNSHNRAREAVPIPWTLPWVGAESTTRSTRRR